MRIISPKFLSLIAVVSATGLGTTSQAQLLWTVGLDDDGWPAGDGGGANASFVQENGTINPLPGVPNSPETNQQADNDYYFAGDFSTVIAGNGSYLPIGPVAVNEEAAERAFAGADNDLRYHFNLPNTLRPFDLLSVTFDANNLDDPGAVNTDPRYGIEVYINGVLVQTQIVIRAAQLGTDYTSPPVTLASVGAQVGPGFDNIVSLRGISYNSEGGGNWMGIDYVQLNATAGMPPEPPIVAGVVETGGDNEATDTITAKWTGQTFPISVDNEPVPGAVIGNSYTVGGFGSLAPCFVDRNHRYTPAEPSALPAYLVGREYIMSGNDNRDNAEYLLDVTIASSATVYLLIDNRLGDADGATPPTFDATHMQWVLDQGWTASSTGANRTGDGSRPDELGIDEGADGTINQYYSVYKKSFAAGTFQLRQADNAGQNMYGVVVGPLREVLRKTVLTPANTVWAYNDTTVTPGLHGTGWELPGYDTNSAPGWKNGPALLGLDTAGVYDGAGQPFIGQGVNGFQTPLDRLIDGVAGRLTFYLRTKFTWTGPTAGVSLITSNWVDDGFVAYLNGVEVSRIRVPAAPEAITWDTLGSNPGTEGLVEVLELPGTALVAGENTLAVEVHQSSAGSSDVAFAIGLDAVEPLAPIITSPSQPTNRVVFANRDTTLIVTAIGSPSPAYQWFKDGAPVDPLLNPSATTSALVITNMQASDAGEYFCRIANAAGSVDSRTATVGYNDDVTPPILVEAGASATFDRISILFDGPLEVTSASDPFNYSVNNGLMISTVTLASDGRSVVLTLATPMAPETDYAVTVANVADLTGNIMPAPGTINLRSWRVGVGCGGAVFEAYNTGGATTVAVSVLTSHPTYPNSPDFRSTINAVDIRVAVDPSNPTYYSTDAREAYGGRIRGYFLASETGPHTFYFASDDNGEFWISTDERPSNKVRLARESTWSNAREWTISGGASSLAAKRGTASLRAGHAYYFEALYKEGGGGDNCAVAVQPPSQANPPADGMDAIGSLLLGSVAPPNVLGPLSIAQEPADATLVANDTATFTVGVNAPTFDGQMVPVCYQWRRDGAEIPGAIGPTYTIPLVSASDDNATFSCDVAIMGASATTRTAVLRVNADTIAPVALQAAAGFSPSNIVVRFSEILQLDPAQDLFNYDVPGFIVTTAVLQPGGTNVVLTVDNALEAGRTYYVTIQNVEDLSGNVVSPNPTTLSFSISSGGGYPATVLAANPIAYWRFNENPPTAINAGSLGAAANGTYNGGATTGSQAPRPPALAGFESGNTALQLDGVDDFVSTLAGLMNDRPVFTVSGWMRRNANQADRTGLWGQNDLIEFGYINNNTLEVWTDNGLDIANGIPNEEWAHLAIVSTGNPGTMSMYTNGVLAGERPHTLPVNNTFPWNIGGGGIFDDIAANGNYFNGQIDEVAIFADAFSPAQILTQYRSALEEPGFSFSDCTIPAGTIATPAIPGTPTTAGGPYVGDDGTGNCVMHLTDRFNDRLNYWGVPLSTAQKFETINARWRTKIEGVGGADGLSFNVGENLGTTFTPEEGAANGLSLCIDTYNNGAGDAGLDIKYNGATLVHLPVPAAGGADGAGAPAELAIGQFVDTSVEVTAAGLVTFRYATFVVTAQIPNYNGIRADQYLFAARTGGANANQWIDDVIFRNTMAAGPVIATDPADQTVREGQPATFSVMATGTEPLSYQWSRKLLSEAAFSPIAGATAASYTTPATAFPTDDSSSFRVLVTNPDGSTESRVATLRVTPLNAPVNLWTVGLDDEGWPAGDGGGANASFVQEAGTNPLPGNPASPEIDQQADDDYYFAGLYSTVIAGNGAYTPVGEVAANEEAAERAFAGTDNDLRYHFNLPSTLGPTDQLSVTFDALNLHVDAATVPDPRYGIEVYINGILVQTQIVIRPAQLGTDYTSRPISLASVGAQVGPGFDNIVSLRGINYSGDGGGSWMGIDYVKLDVTPGVAQTNTPPQFTCGPSQISTQGFGAQIVTGWATDISPSSVTRTPIIYGSDFSSLPAGASLAGSASVNGGALHLTDAVNSQSGQFFTPAVGAPIESLSLDFKLRIGGGTCCGGPIPEGTSRMADGLSVNLGNDLGTGFGEEGTGTGIIVSFDLWDNGEVGAQDASFTAPNIDIRRGGTSAATVGYQALDGEREGGRPPSGSFVTDPATGEPMKLITGDAFASVHINLDADGTMDVDYKGVRVINNIQTGYVPIAGARLGFGARTGGANANQWIDDLQIEAFSPDASSAEAGQTVSFIVSTDHPEYFSVQPAVSSDGTLSYTPSATACGLAKVTIRAMDNGGTANGGNDTSAPCTIDINIVCAGGGANNLPIIYSKDVYTDQGVPVSFTIDASDPDGDPLTYMLLSQPPAGAGVLTISSNLVTYRPTPNYVGMFMFDFKVCDPTGCSFGNNICIFVRPGTGNQPPTARIVATPTSDFAPYLTNDVLISCNYSNASIRLNGFLSSDPETPNSELAFRWFLEPMSLPFAEGVVVSNRLELGRQTVRLDVTDPQGATGSESLTLDVITVKEAIDISIERVEDYDGLTEAEKRKFIEILKVAGVSADRDHVEGEPHGQLTILLLELFQYKTYQDLYPIDPVEAECWILWTEDIIEAERLCAIECDIALNQDPQ